MTTDADFITYVHEQAGLGAALDSRRMFGEYALYVDGKVVALVCDNSVFLKPTAAVRALLGTVEEGPPYPGAKAHFVVDEYLDDGETLARLLRATAAALPMPKPRRPRKSAQPKS